MKRRLLPHVVVLWGHLRRRRRKRLLLLHIPALLELWEQRLGAGETHMYALRALPLPPGPRPVPRPQSSLPGQAPGARRLHTLEQKVARPARRPVVLRLDPDSVGKATRHSHGRARRGEHVH